MKKKIYTGVILILSIVLTGCCLQHQWQDADCSTPKTCSECKKTEGEALGHDWQDAACEAPKTCSRCGKSEGEALGHDWQDATCEAPRTCRLCKDTEGEALGHDWTEANFQTPKTCNLCMITEGEKLSAYFEENGLKCDNNLDTEYDYSTVTPDETLPVKGKIMASNYKKFESDDTHEGKEGYVWRELTLTFTISDTNASNYGYITGTGFADYYQGILDASEDETGKFFWGGQSVGNTYEDTLMVNINGVDYETYIKQTADNGKWSGNTVTKVYTMAWLAPIEYDGAILYVYNGKLSDAETMAEFTEDMENMFIFFKLN